MLFHLSIRDLCQDSHRNRQHHTSEIDNRKFEKSESILDFVKYSLRCGPELGECVLGIIKAITYAQSKLKDYLQFKNTFGEVVPYLEYVLRELKNQMKKYGI